MGLLMEHGGILIGNLHFIMAEKNFKWIEDMFEGDSKDEYILSSNLAEVYVSTANATSEYNYYFN